jgi:3-methyladenine DNA glycosylase/8-oxoguanine DNA glycosylase
VPSLSKATLDETFRAKMDADVKDADHRQYVWWHEGRAVLRTELSTPLRGDVGASLVSHIARQQLHLPRGATDLARLCQCTMSAEEWGAHVAEHAGQANRRL